MENLVYEISKLISEAKEFEEGLNRVIIEYHEALLNLKDR